MGAHCIINNSYSEAVSKKARTGANWTTKEDKAFKNGIATCYNDAAMWDKTALAVPGKTLKSGKVPFPCEVSVHEVSKKSPTHRAQVRRGVPWTLEEHSQFLYGLETFGEGKWKSISLQCVRTKTNSQVASHAQKHFKRSGTVKNGKRFSIFDTTDVEATTSSMPANGRGKSNNAGTKKVLLGNPKAASTPAKNQLLLQGTMEASLDAERQPLPQCPHIAKKKRMPRRPKKVSTAVDQLVPRHPVEASSVVGNQLPHRNHKNASTYIESQLLLPGFLDETPFDVGSSREIMDLDLSLFPHFLD